MKNIIALSLWLFSSALWALHNEVQVRYEQTLIDHPALLLVELRSESASDTRLDLAYRALLESEALQYLARGSEGFQAATFGLQQLRDRQSTLAVRLQLSQALNLDHTGQYAQAFRILDALDRDLPAVSAADLQREIAFTRAVLMTSVGRAADALQLLLPLYEAAPPNAIRASKSDMANAIGNAYGSTDDNVNALRFYLDAHALTTQQNQRIKHNFATYNVGVTYWTMRDATLAKRFLQQSMALSQALADELGVAYIKQVLAEIATEEKDFSTAEQYLNESNQHFVTTQNQYMQCKVLIARAYLSLSQNRSEQAHKWLDQAEQQAQKLNRPPLLHDIYLTRAELFAGQKLFDKGYQAYQRYHESVMQSLSTDERERVDELHVKFETERKDRENDILQQQTILQKTLLEKQQQTIALSISVALLLLTWIGFLFYNGRKNLRQRQHLDALAYTDDLTGMANRRHILSVLDKERERVRRYQSHTSIALIDIDHFKQINDMFGHAHGDKVLKAFTRICASVLRSTDSIGRFGGEEFLLIMPETEMSDAYVMLERLRVTIAHSTFDRFPKEFRITISAGITAMDSLDLTNEEALKRADDAVYHAKHEGRNRVVNLSRAQSLMRDHRTLNERSFELL